MCGSIRLLHNFEPPATPEEARAASLQFVRKVSGMREPSQKNEAAFARAVEAVTAATLERLDALETKGPKRDRALEVEKARARARERYQR